MSYTFPPDPTQSDVEALLQMPPSALITLWTRQQRGAVDALRDLDSLTGDPLYSLAPAYDKPGKREAFEWMQAQMKKRIAGYGDEWPIWTQLTRPSTTDRPGDRLLRLEVRRERILAFFYQPWERLLKIMADGVAPGIRTVHPYIRAFESENEGCPDRPIPDRQQPEWQQCEESWERMFDLTLSRQPRFLWGLDIHAVLASVHSSDVKATLSVPYLA